MSTTATAGSAASSSSNVSSSGVGDVSSSDLHALRLLIVTGLAEDIGSGDVTTLSTIPATTTATARFLAKQSGVLSGLSIATLVFSIVDPTLSVEWTSSDGDFIENGKHFGTVKGKVSSILTAERLALNILQRMGGIATATKKYIDAMGESAKHCKILDTRKTPPGMRVIDKMAVKHGGGVNHRIGLFDMFLVKDNHVDAAGSVTAALEGVQKFIHADLPRRSHIPVEIEARTLTEVLEVLSFTPTVDRILLDNMVKVKKDEEHSGHLIIDTSLLEEAVKLVAGKTKTEASGNVNLHTIGAIAKTGVDFVSVGSLTHSVEAMDISLKISKPEKH